MDFKARISEPSTHAGIAALALAASSFLPQYAPILSGLAALFGGIATVVKEKGTS